MSETANEQFMRLNRLWQNQDAIYHAIAVHIGLSDTDFWILYALCEAKEPFTQNFFCEAWHYPKQTVNSALSKLSAKGLLTLEPLPHAMNRKTLKLTEEGNNFCAQHIRPVVAANLHSFSRLSEEERNLFLSLTEKQLSLLQEEMKKTV